MNVDDDGGSSVSYLGNVTDDGSVISKKRLALFKRIYDIKQTYKQCILDYRAFLEQDLDLEHSKDSAEREQKEQRIAEQVAIYTYNLRVTLFPQIEELEAMAAKAEQKEKAQARTERITAKRAEEKTKKEEAAAKEAEEKEAAAAKKAEEEDVERQKAQEEKADASSSEQDNNIADAQPKPKTKSQQLLETLDSELKENGINFDEFKDKEDFNLENLNANDKSRLSMLILEGFKHSRDKSTHNPGWLLLYFKSIYPELVQLLPHEEFGHFSDMITDTYLKKKDEYNSRYSRVNRETVTLKDLKFHENYKDLPIKDKFLFAISIVARDIGQMGYGHIQGSSDENIMQYLLDSTPFSAIPNRSIKNIYGEDCNSYTLSEEFDNAIEAQSPSSPAQKEIIREQSSRQTPRIYYMVDETPHIVDETQIVEAASFIDYYSNNRTNLYGMEAENQVNMFRQSSRGEPSSEIAHMESHSQNDVSDDGDTISARPPKAVSPLDNPTPDPFNPRRSPINTLPDEYIKSEE